MRPLMSGQLAAGARQGVRGAGPGRCQDRHQAGGDGDRGILAVRAFGPTSLTFVVAISQRITSTKGTGKQITNYAVTLTGTGSSWQVNDIELASAGNQ